MFSMRARPVGVRISPLSHHKGRLLLIYLSLYHNSQILCAHSAAEYAETFDRVEGTGSKASEAAASTNSGSAVPQQSLPPTTTTTTTAACFRPTGRPREMDDTDDGDSIQCFRPPRALVSFASGTCQPTTQGSEIRLCDKACASHRR
jgi:hypothetical protein